MATRLAGSSDLYQPSGRRPYHSINFITSHDGFTLNDLVSYERKHNEANGEDNRDGDNNNYSATTASKARRAASSIDEPPPAADQELAGHAAAQPGRADDRLAATNAAARSAATTTPIARTTPSAGSIGSWSRRTPRCSASCRALIAFRRRQPNVRRGAFLTGKAAKPGQLPDVSWYGPDGTAGRLEANGFQA